MGAEGGILGVVVAVVGIYGAVLVAKISNPGPREQVVVVEHEELAHDMTTIEGLARVVTAQGQKINTLEQREREHTEHAALQDRTIRALRRWAQALENALVGTGAVVPAPEPEDAPLIRS